MIISKKKRNSEEFKRLFCTNPVEGSLSRNDIKTILLNACAKLESKKAEVIDEYDELDDFDFPESYEVTDEEVAEYIVENPNEIVVQFPVVSDIEIEKTLPFFKSVIGKLEKVYGTAI